MLNAKENKKIWLKAAYDNHELLEKRVNGDIEKYRKGYCKLCFTDESGKPLKGKCIKIAQKTHDFGFGANIFMLDEFEDNDYNNRYKENFKRLFNRATVPFYWREIEPKRGKPRYAKDSPKIWRRPAPELCTEFCEKNGIKPKLHCLVYDKFVPDWLPRNDIKQMEELYEERFRQISERFSGRMYEIEVINELLSVFWWKANERTAIVDRHDVVEWAFSLARKYFPDERLVFQDGNYAAELARHGYRHPYFMLLENALRNGNKIDKIGMQHHIYTGVTAKNPQEYDAAVKSFDELADPVKVLKGLDYLAELGLPLEITEITIPTFGDTEEDEELQADLLEMLYSVWFSHPNMEDIIYWNLPDGYAFDDGTGVWNENLCRGGLLHHDLTPKKSADRLYKLINEVWNTEAELVTDADGCVEFRGFYGEYTAECDGVASDFAIHKNECNVTDIVL